MLRDHNASPLNPLPWSVWLLALTIGGVEAALQLGLAGLAGGPEAVGWRLSLVQRLAFTGAHLERMIDTGVWPLADLVRLVGYPFVHAGFVHAAFVVVFLLALGKFVGEAMRAWAVLAVFLVASAVGALVWGAVMRTAYPLLGGYPGVFGLVGAFTWLLWRELSGRGGNRLRAFALIGVLLGMRVTVGLHVGDGVEWLADLAGFVTGFLLSFVLVPGGAAALVARLRAR